MASICSFSVFLYWRNFPPLLLTLLTFLTLLLFVYPASVGLFEGAEVRKINRVSISNLKNLLSVNEYF